HYFQSCLVRIGQHRHHHLFSSFSILVRSYVPLAERTGWARRDSRPRWQTHSIVALLRGIQYRISHHRSFVRSKPRGSPPSAHYCKSCGRNWSIGCSGCVPVLAGTKKGAAGQRLISSVWLVFTSSLAFIVLCQACLGTT